MKKQTILKYFYYLIFSLFVFNSLALTSDGSDNRLPNDLKIGKFKYKEGYGEITVERTQNTQVEYDSGDYRINFSIDWKNETEYNMTFLGGTKGCLNKGDIINVKIVSWTTNGYKYEAYNKRCGGKTIGELIKIE